MKMISSTSTTSTRGVMLISLRTPPVELMFIAMAVTPSAYYGGLGAAGAHRLLLGHHAHMAEAGLVDHLHQRAHVLVLQAPVGLDHHVLVRRRVVDLGQRGLQALLGHPVLVDENR